MVKNANIQKGRGCQNCNKLRQRGRFGIFEIFVVEDEARKLIYDSRADDGAAPARARMACGLCAKTASAKVLAGLTTPEEVIRATVVDDASIY